MAGYAYSEASSVSGRTFLGGASGTTAALSSAATPPELPYHQCITLLHRALVNTALQSHLQTEFRDDNRIMWKAHLSVSLRAGGSEVRHDGYGVAADKKAAKRMAAEDLLHKLAVIQPLPFEQYRDLVLRGERQADMALHEALQRINVVDVLQEDFTSIPPAGSSCRLTLALPPVGAASSGAQGSGRATERSVSVDARGANHKDAEGAASKLLLFHRRISGCEDPLDAVDARLWRAIRALPELIDHFGPGTVESLIADVPLVQVPAPTLLPVTPTSIPRAGAAKVAPAPAAAAASKAGTAAFLLTRERLVVELALYLTELETTSVSMASSAPAAASTNLSLPAAEARSPGATTVTARSAVAGPDMLTSTELYRQDNALGDSLLLLLFRAYRFRVLREDVDACSRDSQRYTSAAHVAMVWDAVMSLAAQLVTAAVGAATPTPAVLPTAVQASSVRHVFPAVDAAVGAAVRKRLGLGLQPSGSGASSDSEFDEALLRLQPQLASLAAGHVRDGYKWKADGVRAGVWRLIGPRLHEAPGAVVAGHLPVEAALPLLQWGAFADWLLRLPDAAAAADTGPAV